MAALRVVLILATVVYLDILASVHGHRLLRSSKPVPDMESLSKWSPKDQNAPQTLQKHMNRVEAEKMSSIRWKQTRSLASKAMKDNTTVSPNSRTLYVTDFGADPTGTKDSTDALLAAIDEAFNVETTRHLMPGVRDLGGAEIHLQGGNYLLTRPLRLPGGGNFVIHGGTLRAFGDFPRDRYLIELWSSSSTRINTTSDLLNGAMKDSSTQSASYEDITIKDLMLDANFIGGGILVINSVRTNIDNCYISHFITHGIIVEGGHETYIRNSFLGQHITAGGSHNEKEFGGVAINLVSNDNAVTDVVIFSAAVGIAVSGQANIFTGVHCYNKATGFGGIGIHLQLPGLTQTRIIGCYMDYTGIVAEDPVQLDITNSFFLGDAYIVLKSRSMRKISGLNIVDNMFAGSNKGVNIVQLDESGGPFQSIDQTVVDRNNVQGMNIRTTVARATIQGNGTTWAMDFSPVLLFPNLIRHVQYSLYTSDLSFPKHAIRNISHNKVVIEADTHISATIAVQVDQCPTFVSGSGIYS